MRVIWLCCSKRIGSWDEVRRTAFDPVLYVYGERDIVKLYIAFVCDDFVKMGVGLVKAVILWKAENENGEKNTICMFYAVKTRKNLIINVKNVRKRQNTALNAQILQL